MPKIKLDDLEPSDSGSEDPPIRQVPGLEVELQSNRKTIMVDFEVPLGESVNLRGHNPAWARFALHPIAAKRLADALHELYDKYEQRNSGTE